MKTTKLLATAIVVTTISIIACSKGGNNNPDPDSAGGTIETSNGITYRVYAQTGQTNYKGILVMGSGNDENNPAPGC